MSIQVATFNVHHCAGSDGRVDVERTAGVVRRTGAQVIALQELDRNMARSGRLDQPAELARLLEMEIFFWPTLRRQSGEYGIALASVTGWSQARFVTLPRLSAEEPRGAIVARVGPVDVVVTHLSTVRQARRAQTAVLAETALALEGPTVVMGDLNQTERHLGPLLEGGFTGAFGHRTLPRRFPRRQIDHILVAGDAAVERSWTLPTAASDHFPLVGSLAIP